jgi:hypothetical protein
MGGNSTREAAPDIGVEIALNKMQSDAELSIGVAAGASQLLALSNATSVLCPDHIRHRRGLVLHRQKEAVQR